MKLRTKLLIGVMAVAVVGGLVWLLSRPHEPDPLYQGKPLTYWLQGFSTGAVRSTNAGKLPTYTEARSAVEHLGTNAIPTLLRLLKTPDRPLVDQVMALLQRQHFVQFTYDRPSLMARADAAWMTLGATASPAVPQLMKIYEQHPSTASREIVPDILGRIGPTASAAVPMLVRATTNDDAYVRNNSVYALGLIGGEPALVVPALTKSLEDPFDNTRANAARALASFGTNARPAVPALLKLIAKEQTNSPAAGPGPPGISGNFDTIWGPKPPTAKQFALVRPGMNIDVLSPVIAALKAIDPEAAAKAGVK